MQFTDLLLSWLQFFLGLLALNKSTDIDLWISEPKNNIFLSQSSVGLKFTPTSTANISTVNYTINVNEGVKYQQMDGFGASLTDASSWLLFYHLSVSKRLEILRQIFGRDGIRISLLRQPIGATDFAWNQWSFDDTTNNIDDFNMSSFSLWREDAYIRPILDQALAIDRGRVKLFATPWSPPAWMKSQKNMIATVGNNKM
jgi:glucosylceramidase